MERDEFRLKLCELTYQRQLSRAHATFQAASNLLPTLIFGALGLFFGLQQAGLITINRFFVLAVSLPTVSVSACLFVVAITVMHKSRMQRIAVEHSIRRMMHRS